MRLRTAGAGLATAALAASVGVIGPASASATTGGNGNDGQSPNPSGSLAVLGTDGCEVGFAVEELDRDGAPRDEFSVAVDGSEYPLAAEPYEVTGAGTYTATLLYNGEALDSETATIPEELCDTEDGDQPPPPANAGLPDAAIRTDKADCGVGVFSVRVVQEPASEFTFTVDGQQRAIRAHPVKVAPGEHTAKVTYTTDAGKIYVMDTATLTIEKCPSDSAGPGDVEQAEPAQPITKRPQFTG